MKKLITVTKGYTLIELLAVISILLVVSGVIVGILYSTLRGSNKTKITAEMTQNGSYALSVISSNVQNSRSVVAIGDEIIPDDIEDCVVKVESTESITLRKTDDSRTTFACLEVDGEDDVYALMQDGVPIIDTSKIQVKAGSCSFTCDQSAGDLYAYPIIGISFILQDKNAIASESRGESLFETSVSLNNYLP